MKKFVFHLSAGLSLLSLFFMSCTSSPENIGTLTVEPSSKPSGSLSTTLTSSETALAVLKETPQLKRPGNSVPTFVELPSKTMSSQQAEDALLKLLRTNGDCMNKCIGGIYPDAMTVQQAIDKLSQWGGVGIYENPKDGKTYFNLDQDPLDGRVQVNLFVGTLTEDKQTIDTVGIRITEVSQNYVSEDLWQANRDAWWGFRFDNLLRAYGVPSYVGFFFQTIVDESTPLEGRTILSAMMIEYQEHDLVINFPHLASYHQGNVALCPAKDPHNLIIDINPDNTEEKRHEVYSVSWQELTDTDLEGFYQYFTVPANPDTCVTTTIQQIVTLQPGFR